jgi:UvrB/uvrC motif
VTEAEWNACTDPTRMLGFLRGTTSDRKLQLYARQCVRYITGNLSNERYEEEWAALQAALVSLKEQLIREQDFETAAQVRDMERAVAGDYDGLEKARRVANRALSQAQRLRKDRRQEMSDLLRDIFGNPFRPLTITPAWLTATDVAIAHTSYDDCILPAATLDNARLVVLADALEDAGCSDAELLAHLRSHGPHVRGCFAVDWVLGWK